MLSWFLFPDPLIVLGCLFLAPCRDPEPGKCGSSGRRNRKVLLSLLSKAFPFDFQLLCHSGLKSLLGGGWALLAVLLFPALSRWQEKSLFSDPAKDFSPVARREKRELFGHEMI